MRTSFNSRRSVRGAWEPDDIPLLVLGLVVIAALLMAFGFLIDYSALDAWTGILTFLVLTAASVPLFRWVARADGDPWLFKVLMAGLMFKFAGSMARFFMIFVLYNGSGDGGRYHEAGVTFVNRLRDGIPIHPIPIMEGFPVETQRIADSVGGLYTITGPSVYAGFLVFAFICFWGQVLIARAFRAAVPEGDHRRFTLLVLFLPSLLFWPSSLGKEALMIGCLGLIIYGGGLLLAPKPRIHGAAYFVAGTLLVLFIRPHVAAMSIGAIGLAFAVGLLGGFQGGGGGAGRGRAVRLAALVAVLVLAAAALTRLGEAFEEFSEEEGGAQASLEQTAGQTARGGSEFDPAAITGPANLPAGVVTVFFRPFPWEASSLNSLIAAAEGLLLLGLFAVSWRRLLSLPRLALRRPFLVFCLSYVLAFSVAFSYIANFGILSRQRTQALIVLVVVLALPKADVPSLSYRARDRRSEADPGAKQSPGDSSSSGPEVVTGTLEAMGGSTAQAGR